MNAQGFDDLLRSFADRRRAIQGGMLALASGGVTAVGVDSKKRKKKKKRKRKKIREFCPGDTKPCGTVCIPVDDCCTNRDCGSCESCLNGDCISGCIEGQHCQDEKCICSPESCDGCCDGDSCWNGEFADFCGTGGAECEVCTGGKGCDDGVCRCSLGWRECRGVCISDTRCCTDDQCASGRQCASNGSCATSCPSGDGCRVACACAQGPDPDLARLCYDEIYLGFDPCNRFPCNRHADCQSGFGCVSTHCGDVPINRCVELCRPQ